MKKFVVGSVLAITLACAPFSASANSVAAPTKNATWLEILNYYRLSSGLTPVSEDLEMSNAAQNHANYLAKTNMKYLVKEFANLHTENPASPYYNVTASALGAGDIAWTSVFSQRPIDQLMSAPFHAIGLLHETFTKVGFGTAPVEVGGYFPGHQVTTLATVAGTSNALRTKSIFFPGANSTISINDFHTESPDPRESCGPNFRKYTGLPIFASILDAPSLRTSAFLTMPTGEILSNSRDLCVITEHNLKSTDPIYGAAARSIMSDEHMILVIPREPLKIGKYGVVIKQKNLADLSWKFTYADTFEKVENKVTIVYPHTDKLLFVGDIVKIKLMSLDAGASSHATGTATCLIKWHGNELWVTGKSTGTCTVNLSGGASADTKSFKKSIALTFIAKKK